VWRVTCVESHLCGGSPVWKITCVESHLCGGSPVWRVTCVESHLCGGSPVWRLTCVLLVRRRWSPGQLAVQQDTRQDHQQRQEDAVHCGDSRDKTTANRPIHTRLMRRTGPTANTPSIHACIHMLHAYAVKTITYTSALVNVRYNV